MSLSSKQRDFVRCVGKLIDWAYENGYALSFGDAYRDPRVFGDYGVRFGYGRSRSNHKRRLAVDFNLFKKVEQDWVYQRSTEAHKPLGEYWESLDSRCRWGGRFDDGNHYSFEHEGSR